jgi:hypothetical protein
MCVENFDSLNRELVSSKKARHLRMYNDWLGASRPHHKCGATGHRICDVQTAVTVSEKTVPHVRKMREFYYCRFGQPYWKMAVVDPFRLTKPRTADIRRTAAPLPTLVHGVKPTARCHNTIDARSVRNINRSNGPRRTVSSVKPKILHTD